MKNEFIQPVSMQVTKEQYERDLREPLLTMGYEEVDMTEWDENPILATNYGGIKYEINSLAEECKENNNRYFIPEYNPKLFLAIAAMTKGKNPIVGEWLVCIDDTIYTGNYKVGDFIQNKNPNITLVCLRRATLQELIQKFTKQNTMEKFISINVKDVITLAQKDEKIKQVLESLFPTVFQKEKEDAKPFVKIGAILKRKDKGSIYAVMHDRKTKKVVLINITNGYYFANSISIDHLKDKNRKTLTKGEFNFITIDSADEFEEMEVITSKPYAVQTPTDFGTNNTVQSNGNIGLDKSAGFSITNAFGKSTMRTETSIESDSVHEKERALKNLSEKEIANIVLNYLGLELIEL